MPDPVHITTFLEPREPAAAVILTDDQVAEIGQGAKTPPRAARTADAAARAAFDALARSHRKEDARWVADAKRPETREQRVAETLAGVLAGKTRR